MGIPITGKYGFYIETGTWQIGFVNGHIHKPIHFRVVIWFILKYFPSSHELVMHCWEKVESIPISAILSRLLENTIAKRKRSMYSQPEGIAIGW